VRSFLVLARPAWSAFLSPRRVGRGKNDKISLRSGSVLLLFFLGTRFLDYPTRLACGIGPHTKEGSITHSTSHIISRKVIARIYIEVYRYFVFSSTSTRLIRSFQIGGNCRKSLNLPKLVKIHGITVAFARFLFATG